MAFFYGGAAQVRFRPGAKASIPGRDIVCVLLVLSIISFHGAAADLNHDITCLNSLATFNSVTDPCGHVGNGSRQHFWRHRVRQGGEGEGGAAHLQLLPAQRTSAMHVSVP